VEIVRPARGASCDGHERRALESAVLSRGMLYSVDASREEKSPDEGLEILTIGHSTREAAQLLGLLQAHGVRTVVDVRSVPRSRRNPQFESETLAATLAAEGIAYLHLPELGGFRRPRPDSPNMGLRHPSFRGYADHMMTGEFEAGVSRLLELARDGRTAVLCAEANPMRCHRRLLSDALVARGVAVAHITSRQAPRPHRLMEEAEVRDGRVTYPPREQALF
jgi:uncharacterized protein (DUF488 family)